MEPLATVILIHGYTGSPDKPRYHWLRNKLEAQTIVSKFPVMPKADHPVEPEWLDVIDAQVRSAKTPIILVGHSLGGLAVLRWLEERATEPIHAAISLAGVINPARYTDTTFATEWNSVSDWSRVRTGARHILGIYSTDDPAVPIAEADVLEAKVGDTILRVDGRGHFTSADGVTELPELLQMIETLIQLAK